MCPHVFRWLIQTSLESAELELKLQARGAVSTRIHARKPRFSCRIDPIFRSLYTSPRFSNSIITDIDREGLPRLIRAFQTGCFFDKVENMRFCFSINQKSALVSCFTSSVVFFHKGNVGK